MLDNPPTGEEKTRGKRNMVLKKNTENSLDRANKQQERVKNSDRENT